MKPVLVDYKLLPMKAKLPKLPKIYHNNTKIKISKPLVSNQFLLAIFFLLACIGLLYLRWTTKLNKTQKHQKTKEMLEQIKRLTI